MDNFFIDVVAEGKQSLADALRVAWLANCPGGKATHYQAGSFTENERGVLVPVQDGVQSCTAVTTLILYWSERDGDALPYPIDFDGAVEFVQRWLDQCDRGRQPDHDGDNGKGWRVFTEAWGHVGGSPYAIVGVQPIWAMYGK